MARSEAPSISVSRRGSARGDTDRTVVWVRGEHDLATRVSLVVAIARAARLDDADLFVDLSGVTFMDASTVGAIVGSVNRLRSQSLAVRAPSPRALRLLDVCGLTRLVHPVPERAVHPFGVAAALSTWVDVPPSEPSDPGPSRDLVTLERAAQPAVGEPARSMLATIDAATDRGDP